MPLPAAPKAPAVVAIARTKEVYSRSAIFRVSGEGGGVGGGGWEGGGHNLSLPALRLVWHGELKNFKIIINSCSVSSRSNISTSLISSNNNNTTAGLAGKLKKIETTSTAAALVQKQQPQQQQQQ